MTARPGWPRSASDQGGDSAGKSPPSPDGVSPRYAAARPADPPEDEFQLVHLILRSQPRPGTLPVGHHEGRTLGTMTRLPAPPVAPAGVSARAATRRDHPRAVRPGTPANRTHPLAGDALLAAVLLGLCSAWLSWSSWVGYRAAIVQTALIAVLIFRRLHPSAVFLAACAIAFAQWLLGFPLLGDVALLVALYTVAAHESRIRALLATGLLGAGSVMAAAKWQLAGTGAALAAVPVRDGGGRAVRRADRGLGKQVPGLDGRARPQARDRARPASGDRGGRRADPDCQGTARHRLHSLSVVITLADAASVVGRSDPAGGVEAMTEASEVARCALTDMRAMLGVLRTEEPSAGLAPQPGIDDLGALVERIRATGLPVDLSVEGTPFPLGAAAELTAYRVVQEALTNTLRHAKARHATVTIAYDQPQLRVRIADDGTARTPATARRGHGIEGMRERTALHGGTLRAGPDPDAPAGWLVEATLAEATLGRP